MSGLEYKPFKNPSNIDVFNAIRNNASYDYQSRIPNADKANIDDSINELMNYTPSMNEFLYQLVNVIGLQIYKATDSFTNPLAKFKREPLKVGDTIEEIMSGILTAHRYNANAEYLEEEIWGTERPETQVNFHKINRKDYYKLTINEVELRKAFTSEFGLSAFLTNLMATPQTSDQLDEFLVTAGLLKTWHDKGGYFNVNIPDISALDSDAADSKYALRRLRELGDTLPFPSRRYNPAGMYMAANRDELELIITPQANAAMDVEALAGAFNVPYAEFATRKTVIPAEYIGIDGFQAMLTTRDFFVLADSYYDVKSIQNPAGLTSNYFLHHHEVISASRFAPAILFTSTEESTPIVLVDTPVETISAPTLKDAGGDAATTLIRGMSYQVYASATTDPAGGVNTAVVLDLVGAESVRTKIWQNGFLTIAIDETADTLTINTVAVDDEDITSTATFNVVGDYARLWPNPVALEDDDLDNVLEVTPMALAITAAGNVKIPSQEGLDWNKVITTGVTFTDAGDIVTIPNHGLAIGDTVKFGTITGTTGITAGTTYYVKTVPTVDTVTLSATEGGATLALTTNGTSVSATIPVENGTTQKVATGQTITFNALPESGYEITSGATTAFPLTH